VTVVLEDLRVCAGRVLQLGIHVVECLDQAACTGTGGHTACLDIAECLHRQLHVLGFLGLLDFGMEQSLGAAGTS